MWELHQMGGPLFMFTLSAIALVILALVLKKAADLFLRNEIPAGYARTLNAIPELGVFAFFLGVLAQAIGLYQAMTAIEGAGDVSPALLAGGFKVSLIAPIYGLLILLFAVAAWILLKHRYHTLSA